MIQETIDSLVAMLPLKLQPVAKALAPVAVAFVAAVVSAIQSGVGPKQALYLGIGAVLALVVYKVPNTPVHADIEEIA